MTMECLMTGSANTVWMPPILRTVASRGEGIGELLAAIERILGKP